MEMNEWIEQKRPVDTRVHRTCGFPQCGVLVRSFAGLATFVDRVFDFAVS